jgi:hypothetical protein
VAKYKAKCHVCQQVSKDEQQPTRCTWCDTDLTNPGAETPLRSTVSQHTPVGTKFAWDGQLIMTNQRLFFLKFSRAGSGGGGLVGALAAEAINAATRGEKIGILITPGMVSGVEIGKYSILAKGLIIRTTDGVEHKFMLRKKDQEEWVGAIRQGFMTQG